MKLWIRSQDKMQLIKINEIHIEVDEDGFVGIWVDNKKENLKYYLGTYETKKRALEVLDEIELALGCKRTVFNNTIVFVNVLENINSMVYEMPKD